MKFASLACVLFAAAAVGTASAQPAMLSNSDIYFLHHALRGGRTEVAMGRYTLGHGGPRAMRFANRMIADHSRNDQQLVALDRRLGVSPGSGAMLPEARQEMTRLERMSGEARSADYLRYETQDHRDDINEFRTELTQTSNPQIRQFVGMTLPVLRAHLDLALALARR